jgi:hypothetical protein
MSKCVWCGKTAALYIRIIEESGETSSESPICWVCIYNAAKKRKRQMMKERERE